LSRESQRSNGSAPVAECFAHWFNGSPPLDYLITAPQGASRREEMNKYEAAEVIVVGTANEMILGEKVLWQMDNVSSGDPFLREETLAMFDE
jgi:hypothetical protein